METKKVIRVEARQTPEQNGLFRKNMEAAGFSNTSAYINMRCCSPIMLPMNDIVSVNESLEAIRTDCLCMSNTEMQVRIQNNLNNISSIINRGGLQQWQF